MRMADTSSPAVPDEGGQGRGEQLLQRHHALLAEYVTPPSGPTG